MIRLYLYLSAYHILFKHIVLFYALTTNNTQVYISKTITKKLFKLIIILTNIKNIQYDL